MITEKFQEYFNAAVKDLYIIRLAWMSVNTNIYIDNLQKSLLSIFFACSYSMQIGVKESRRVKELKSLYDFYFHYFVCLESVSQSLGGCFI